MLFALVGGVFIDLSRFLQTSLSVHCIERLPGMLLKPLSHCCVEHARLLCQNCSHVWQLLFSECDLLGILG